MSTDAWLVDDPAFGPAWLDVDEWRDEPVRHRYVHGGFGATNTRFEMRLPEPIFWRRRLFQFLGGGQGGRLATDWIGDRGFTVAVSNGAYYVSSNQGWRTGEDAPPGDLSILAYRANAQTARFSARFAEEMYGRRPDYRYVFGWSGGGDRSINALEQTAGLYHGAIAGGVIYANVSWEAWSLAAWAAPLLRPLVPQIVATLDPGGSGDPFSVLQTDAQREALAALYAAGFPRGAEVFLASASLSSPGFFYVPQADPTYFTDFWTKRGYAGHDGGVRRMVGKGVVREVLTLIDVAERDDVPADVCAWLAELPSDAPAGLRISTDLEAGDLVGAHVCVTSGERAGTEFQVAATTRDLFFASPHASLTLGVGDEVEIDNGRWVAFQHWHRHAPERRGITKEALHCLPYTGAFEGKLILIQALQDHPAMTTAGHLYAQHVTERARFRLWWLENADHMPHAAGGFGARFVDFWPAFVQGLRDLMAWVEHDVEPPPSTRYHRQEDGILRLEPGPSQRGGIQPVVALTANGVAATQARIGEAVLLHANAEVPQDAGCVTSVAWDPLGTGEWQRGEDVAPGPRAGLSTTHIYTEAGTFFPGVRVGLHRDGLTHDRAATIENIARARVIVTPHPAS